MYRLLVIATAVAQAVARFAAALMTFAHDVTDTAEQTAVAVRRAAASGKLNDAVDALNAATARLTTERTAFLKEVDAIKAAHPNHG